MDYLRDWVMLAALIVGLVWLACLVLTLPVLLIWALRRSRRRPRLGRRPQLVRATPYEMQAAVREISTYTHNPDTAARLLHHTRLENRDRSLQWCVEKTIYDLVRDRR